MQVDPTELTAAEAARRIADGRMSCLELTEACLRRISNKDAAIQAWLHVDGQGAIASAKLKQAEVGAGHALGPLHGIPVAIKDLIDVAGMPTTCGAAAFAHYRPNKDAECVARLRQAGAIIIGKVTTTEFAYFEPSPTRNPWNGDHTPGGSSSGSAAATAAGMVPLALGSQTIGSILRPAAFCGIVGYKGTFGAVPTRGVFPMTNSFDHIGVLCRSVEDAGIAFSVLSARAMADVASAVPDFLWPEELVERAAPETASAIRAIREQFAAAGANFTEIRLPPSFSGIHDAAQAILEAEFASVHQELYARHAASYRPRTRELVERGLQRSAVSYLGAQRLRAAFSADMNRLIGNSILISPTAEGAAPKGLGYTGNPWFCTPWSSMGTPAVALPVKFGAEGLPLSVQLVASPGCDAALLSAARWSEKRIGFGSEHRSAA